jgi:membrane protease YdiL (CAAX protease family)
MTSTIDHPNDNKHMGLFSRLSKISGWTIVLIFLPQFILGFIFSIFLSAQQGGNLSTEVVDAWFLSVSVQLLIALVTPLIFFPLLIKATNVTGWNNQLAFLAVKSINRKGIIIWLSITTIYCICSFLISFLLNLPVEPFMNEVKDASNSFLMLALILTTISIVIPVMEGVLFRGWLYSPPCQNSCHSLKFNFFRTGSGNRTINV